MSSMLTPRMIGMPSCDPAGCAESRSQSVVRASGAKSLPDPFAFPRRGP